MSRNRFEEIRASIRFTFQHGDDVFEKEHDPIWHSRVLLGDFLRHCSQVAVPLHATALDENSCRTKARTKAKSYLPTKPDKYAVRIYCVVEWRTLYLHSFFDNGSGNSTNTTIVRRFVDIFPELRTPINKFCSLNDGTATSLWLSMILKQHQSIESPSGKRVFVMDNFYTRHIMAQKLLEMTNGEVRVIGTVRMNFVDQLNKPQVLTAIEQIKDQPRNTSILVRARNANEHAQQASRTRRRGRQRGTMLCQDASGSRNTWIVAEKTAFIVWKDSKLVIIYTTDLNSTPSRDIIMGSDVEAIRCVHGLVSVDRWVGVEVFRRSKMKVPAIVAAYNIFMNSVDIMDQLRATTPSRRKEKRLAMSLFTWVLDFATSNAYAIFKHLREKGSIPLDALSFQVFKHKVITQIRTVSSSGRFANRHWAATANARENGCPAPAIYGLKSPTLEYCNTGTTCKTRRRTARVIGIERS